MGVCDALAQSRTVEEIADYRGADRQAALEAGAEREGHLLVYCNCGSYTTVIQAFQRRYPFIHIDTFEGDVPTTSRRIMEENAAQNRVVDIVALTPNGLRLLADAELLQSFQSPQLAEFDPAAIGAGQYWVHEYQSFLGLGYNTDLVPQTEAPRTYDDLLDPKWRGRIAMSGTVTLVNWIGAVLREKEISYLQRLAQQQIRIYQVSARAVANLIISGEVPLSPTIYASHVAKSSAAGAKIAWHPLGGVYSDTDAVALARYAPHPNAAMLYIDFILSKDGQELFRSLGYVSARKDIENPEKPDKIYYLGEEPDYLQNYEKWTAIAQQMFGH